MKKLLDMNIRQGDDIVIPGTGKGDLLISIAAGGTFYGDSLSGKILPVGAGTTYTPSEGINVIHVPVLMETSDSAMIFMEIDAYLHLSQELEEKFIAGETVPVEDYYYKGNVRFSTGEKRYKWLEDRVFICIGEIYDWSSLKFTVYEA